MWLEKLREMKAASGLTTREIAERSNLPEPTLEKIFSGATKDPKLATIRQLVHFFGRTLDDLDDSPATKNDPANPKVDEAELDAELIDRLCRLTPEEAQKVDAFAQGLLASRSSEPSPGA